MLARFLSVSDSWWWQTPQAGLPRGDHKKTLARSTHLKIVKLFLFSQSHFLSSIVTLLILEGDVESSKRKILATNLPRSAGRSMRVYMRVCVSGQNVAPEFIL
jgi:hypothetical protein